MELKGIIAIAGKPGLFKIIAQSKQGLIVESFLDGKRIPAHANNKVSALEDISMYTVDDDVPLSDVMQKIYDKEDGGQAIDHKSPADQLHTYFEDVLPDYDKDRVYNSDLKKLFSWYNILQDSGILKERVEEAQENAKAEAKEEAPTEKAEETKEA